MANDATADSRIKVRRVTSVHANWSEQGELTAGKFSVQLILDNGALEQLVMPTAQDVKVLVKLLDSSDTVFFDVERGVISFNNV
ncbi:Hypothetical Protein RradSPS_1216 [Rubrobacter radiotolerans]|uniref:Uncharacterized protein n=1 Tax=Rubrobacter radiotolerans TaxID=42256 RepID=A0A023X353_RUBRA|nr:hypothetical protein [Rubrobacter radiotolerans]AHY46499.1 Hypothetical Protein RradSPS_1216 [Rubrobacter radiotolerans]MDX5893906.1 hypothetical protein [Rubrobacter radiotolerans]SMC04744.1 conserved hypothetical protein [Rubrobacter radiotolerans DSM 5868]